MIVSLLCCGDTAFQDLFVLFFDARDLVVRITQIVPVTPLSMLAPVAVFFLFCALWQSFSQRENLTLEIVEWCPEFCCGAKRRLVETLGSELGVESGFISSCAVESVTLLMVRPPLPKPKITTCEQMIGLGADESPCLLELFSPKKIQSSRPGSVSSEFACQSVFIISSSGIYLVVRLALLRMRLLRFDVECLDWI